MTSPKFLTPSAVIVLIVREVGGKRQVLCQRRANTDFAEGMFDFSCSGKVERGECMTEAAVREVREELGVEIERSDLQFAAFVHKYDADYDITYLNVYFTCQNYIGEPIIAEPEKCSELKWFDFDGLPDDLIGDRRAALEAYLKGESFIEYGWNCSD